MAGHKEVGFVWQELQLKPKIWLHTSYLSPALLQCLQRNQKLYISVIEFQWILVHFVEHECKFCCDLCAFSLEKTSAKDLACGDNTNMRYVWISSQNESHKKFDWKFSILHFAKTLLKLLADNRFGDSKEWFCFNFTVNQILKAQQSCFAKRYLSNSYLCRYKKPYFMSRLDLCMAWFTFWGWLWVEKIQVTCWTFG